MAEREQEIEWARRAYPKAQELLSAATPINRLAGFVPVGWHDTATHPLTGALAVVRIGGELEPLIGDILRVAWRHWSTFVYVVGARDVPFELSLARRAFMDLANLAAESIDCVVEVCE